MSNTTPKHLKHFFVEGNILDFSKEYIGEFTLNQLLEPIHEELRFCSQINWSVLQHSLAVGMAAAHLYEGNNLLIQHAYFHDIQESIVRDVPTPWKNYIGKAWWDMEAMVQAKIFNHLRISPILGDADANKVHELDRTMCYVEIVNFYGPDCEMLDGWEVNPSILVLCTMAFDEVKNNPVTDEYNNIRQDVIQHFKEIISLSTL